MQIRMSIVSVLAVLLLIGAVCASVVPAQSAELKKAQPVFYLYGPGRLKSPDPLAKGAPYGIEKIGKGVPLPELARAKSGAHAIAIATVTEDALWRKYRVFIHSGEPGSETGWYVMYDRPLAPELLDPVQKTHWIASGEEAVRIAHLSPVEEALQLVAVRLPPEAAEKDVDNKKLVVYLRSVVTYLDDKARVAQRLSPQARQNDSEDLSSRPRAASFVLQNKDPQRVGACSR